MFKKDKKLNALYQQMYKDLNNLCEKNDPLMVAGIMMAQAIKIYKTALPEDDFERMMDTIADSKDIVKPLNTPTIN
jgi:hypothetical protein